DVIKDINTKRMELITATVMESSPRGTTFSFKSGREQIDLFLKPEESVPGEILYPGDRRKILIIGADRTDRGIRITITRAAEQFVAKLFEQAVPEIKNGKIIVKGIVREPGIRTKLAVESTDPSIDPVGSCIGPNRARVEAVRQELGEEKIDIIPFSQDSSEYIAKALAPAKVISVEPDPENAKKYNVRVKEDQFSLAIGAKGVNVALAAKLTGYKIDIMKAE
ncbi:MAG: transcription termination/antitermination protein NusA, partial [Clostridia bacterium]|nr:transcription termination/antitermination protein NusA [Clostridia bacterium]